MSEYLVTIKDNFRVLFYSKLLLQLNYKYNKLYKNKKIGFLQIVFQPEKNNLIKHYKKFIKFYKNNLNLQQCFLNK